LGGASKYDASLKWWLKTPDCDATKWVVLYPDPPNTDNQRLLSASLTADGTPASGASIRELSPYQRAVLMINFDANDQTRHSIATFGHYSIALAPRQLVPGAGPELGSPLAAGDRQLYLSSSGLLDYRSSSFQHWLQSEELLRRANESDMDFAWRVFSKIRALYVYNYDSAQDRHASQLCSTNRTDCGGLSIMFASTLRNSGIPARTLFGRHTTSDKAPGDVRTTYGAAHVISEFYQPEVGWIPVEMSGAVSRKDADPLRFFGRDPGNLVTLHYDTDLQVDTILFGQSLVEYLQCPTFWVRGHGTTDNWSAQILWQITKN
jgi:hypothetical protein